MAHPRLRLPVLCALSVSARVWARRRCANLHTRSTDLTNGPRGGWSVSRRVSTRVGKVFRGAASTKQGAGQAMGVSQHGGAMREQGTAWDSAGAARLPLRGYARCRDHCLAPSTDLLRMPKSFPCIPIGPAPPPSDDREKTQTHHPREYDITTCISCTACVSLVEVVQGRRPEGRQREGSAGTAFSIQTLASLPSPYSPCKRDAFVLSFGAGEEAVILGPLSPL